MVQLLFKHYLLNLYPFLTNNNLLSQNLRLQLHYLPHIQDFKVLWRKSLRTWLNLWKLSLTPPTSSTPPVPPAPMTRSTQETPAPALEASTTSVPTPIQPGDQQGSQPVEVPIKAKPPTPPDLVQQAQQPPLDRPPRNSQRSPLTRENRSSRRSRSRRRFTHRRRDSSPETHRQETERRTTMTRGNFDRHPPATTSRTPRSEPIDGRPRDHPIYRRENVFRQIHQDANYTIYTKDTKDKAKSTYGSTFQRSRKDSTITLRSRSKSRKSKRSTTPLAIFERPAGVQLHAKARPGRPQALEDTATRETSVSEATES